MLLFLRDEIGPTQNLSLNESKEIVIEPPGTKDSGNDGRGLPHSVKYSQWRSLRADKF